MSSPEQPAAPVRPRRWPWLLLVAVAGAFALRPLLQPATPAPLTCGRDVAPDDDTLVMLSASWCGYCRAARRWLQAEEIRYCEYDVETSQEGWRRYDALPVKVVPVFQLRSETLVGFNRDEIRQTLAAHGLAELPD